MEPEITTVLGQSVRHWRRQLGMNQAEFAAALGISRQTVSNYERGTTEPDESTIEQIRRMIKGEDSETVSLPYYENGVSAGGGMVQEPPTQFLTIPRRVAISMSGGSISHTGEGGVTKVRGISMYPTLRDGEDVWIQYCDHIIDAGIYAVWIGNRQVDVIKRLELVGNSHLRIISDNEAFPSYLLRHLEGDEYEDANSGEPWTIQIRGVMRYPEDRAAHEHRAVRFASRIARETLSVLRDAR